jgi:dephospho-CoA kinase
LLPLAVTGGVAEGKSTVLQLLEQQGWRTISADAISKELFQDPSVQEAIANRFDLPTPLDRGAVRAKIAESHQNRRFLNTLMHHRVLDELIQSDAQAIEVPLLIETCLQPLFKRVWVVTCGREEQERRLRDRLQNEGQVQGVLRLQLPTAAKEPFADEIIRTNVPRQTVQSHVWRLAAKVR